MRGFGACLPAVAQLNWQGTRPSFLLPWSLRASCPMLRDNSHTTPTRVSIARPDIPTHPRAARTHSPPCILVTTAAAHVPMPPASSLHLRSALARAGAPGPISVPAPVIHTPAAFVACPSPHPSTHPSRPPPHRSSYPAPLAPVPQPHRVPNARLPEVHYGALSALENGTDIRCGHGGILRAWYVTALC